MFALLGALTACAQVQTVSAPPTPTVQAASAERGKVMFVDKGCITCHVNNRAQTGERVFTMEGIPNLTNYQNDPAFLRRWLADPQAVRPSTTMPNLQLSASEIDDLIAFINAPREP